ncbi:MAG TPA: NAD(P)/FAD-dependent oxidoreductase [Thermoanaerobaculia bacterium]
MNTQRHEKTLVEEGAALFPWSAPDDSSRSDASAGRLDALVIGAGQAGLSVGYFLAKAGLRFAILDENARVGDSWRRRWDSLRLFTVARFDGLVGMPFPAPRYSFPTKDEMADYLEAYAKKFQLPVVQGVRVDRLRRDGNRYVAESGGRRWYARQVIVAMASYQKGRVPKFAAELDSGILQLHSADYRNSGQLRPGGVLVVGASNSGAEIALDIARSRAGNDRDFAPIYLAGRDPGQMPFRISRPWTKRILGPFLFRVVFHRILSLGTPLGRKARPRIISKGAPLIRVRKEEFAAAGIQRVPRIAGAQNGRPLLDDGRALDVPNIIWATGFHPGFEWIDLPISRDEHGEPVQDRGVVPGEPGLCFVGLHFLYAMSSTMIHGVERDARYVARVVVRRAAASLATTRNQKWSTSKTRSFSSGW